MNPVMTWRLGYMYIVPLRNAGRAVPHQTGEAEFVHPTFGAAGSGGMPQAVKLNQLLYLTEPTLLG